MLIAVFLLKYIATWITMIVSLIVLLGASELAYGFLLSGLAGRRNTGIIDQIRSAATSLMISPVLLPDCASRHVVLAMPVLAVAGLFPVCSSISFFTFSNLIDNGGDILQIIHFVILSQTFALAAIYAIGTEYASHSASRLAGEFIKLLAVLTAAFASFAIYFTALGVQGNPFSLDVYSLSLHLKSLNVPGYIAIVIFVFLALYYSSGREEYDSGDIFSEIPLREFNGFPRGMLQIWAAFKAFLTVTLITHIFFPWFLFKEAENGNESFWTHVLAFALFWLTVIVVRVFGAMFSRNVRSYLEKKIPGMALSLFFIALTAVAVGIIYYEAYLVSLEAY